MIFVDFTIPRGFRRFVLILPAMIAGFGIQNLYVYFTNPKPIEVSIEQLITNPPRAKWVRVIGGRINLMDSAVSEVGSQKEIAEVYVPIHPEGKDEAMVSVLLLSTDPKLLAVARQFHSLDQTKDSELGGLKIAMGNSDVILQKRPFEGLIQSGLFRDDRVIFQIRKTLPNIVRMPIIIEEGKKPNILEGLGLLLLAVLATIGIFSQTAPQEATPPPLPPTPPPLPRNG